VTEQVLEIERVPCARCGGERFDPLFRDCPDRRHQTPGRFDIVRCHGCGLAQTNPRPTRQAITGHYPSSYTAFEQHEFRRGPLGRALRWAVRLPYTLRYGPERLIEPASRPGMRAVDVGCGSGVVLAELVRAGWEAWGVEPEAEVARAVAARLGLPDGRLVVATAEAAELPEGAFDLVTMSHVLEHLHDPRAALAKAHHWLRPGGQLRIWVPNIASAESRVFGRLWFGLDMPRHLYHFDLRSLWRLLVESGFRVERVAPQCQGFSLGASLQHAVDALTGRQTEFRQSRPLYYATLPLAMTLAALGNHAVLDVTARRP
jgi:SAM-dependent methyltransferase